jgi:hypothetical protein
MLDDLTERELALVDAARGGTVLECGDDLRAELIRELLLGRRGEVDPRGVRLRGARIVGALALEHIRTVAGLVLVECVLDEPVNLTRTALPRLVLTGSRLAGVHGDGVQVDGDLLLDRTTILGTGAMGAVCLRRAHIGGVLDLEEAEVGNDSGPALHASGLQAESVILRRARMTGTGGRSTIRLSDAHVRGVLNMEGAELSNETGPALHADRLRVDGLLFLRDGRLTGHGGGGTVSMRGARVGGEFNLHRAELRNDTGPALDAYGLAVGGAICADQMLCSGAGERGAIRLHGTRVGGRLTMDDAEISNSTGPAVYARGVSVDGNLDIERTRVSGAGGDGAICLASAHLGDDFYLVASQVSNDSGPALYADGLRVEDTIVVMETRMTATSDSGAVWLLGAHLGGLRVVDTELANDAGPALFADQLQVRGLVHLERVRLSAVGARAAVRLAVPRIGGQFTLMRVTISNPAGPLLDLHGTEVAGGVHLPAEVICRDEDACGPATVDVHDFAYPSLAGASWLQWLHVIRCHTVVYRSSPYQQLAAAERSAGHDDRVRHILITQQHDLRHRAPVTLGGWLTRRFHWLWGALAGYGYRARRTALALLVALAAAGLVSLWAGHVPTGPGRYAAEHTATPTPCSTVELIGLGLDRGLPLGPTGLRTRCDLDTESTAGQVFTVLLWIVQAAVWGLATLALAGYTGLIRKTA